jgi:hypothetical protein
MSEYIPREEAIDAIIKLAKELREADDEWDAIAYILSIWKEEQEANNDRS